MRPADRLPGCRRGISSSASASSLRLLALLGVALSSCAGAGAVPYGIGQWPETGRGNHRAVVRVSQPADAVWAHVEWRRRDQHPEAKAVLVYDAATGQRVRNVVRVRVTREFGDLVFQPATVPGDYEVYYLPYNPGTSNFDEAGTYFRPEETADPAWVAKHGLAPGQFPTGSGGQQLQFPPGSGGQGGSLPRASLVAIQARTDFHRMDPMEVIATAKETGQLLAAHLGRTYLVFPEDRKCAVRMFEDLPQKWIQEGPRQSFAGEARPGEYYVFQVGVWAAREPIRNLALRFSDLKGADGKLIPARQLTCFNLEGTDWLGRPMRKAFAVGRGQVRALWVGVSVPKDAAGTYRGTVVVRPAGAERQTVSLALRVAGPVLADAGDSELWRLSRLRWLNSTLGLDDEVIPPFTPLQVKGSRVACLGREVRFGPLGLPEGITSTGQEVLAAPMRLLVETPAGPVRWVPGATRTTSARLPAPPSPPKLGGDRGGRLAGRLGGRPGIIERASVARSGALSMGVESRMEADGCLFFRARLKARRPTDLRDVRLEIPMRRAAATYLMGFSQRGGLRPRDLRWKWNINRVDNMVWVGGMHAGLQLKLLGPKDVWDLNNLRSMGLPASWHNGGKGGARVAQEGNRVVVRAFSGSRRLEAGKTLEFRFRLLITPLKPVDRRHWDWRYGDPNASANILHVHHGTPETPHINYPFPTADGLAAVVKQVRSIRYKATDPGGLTYPAGGNLNPEHGALHVWVRLNFDPRVHAPQHAEYNQNLFELTFPNQDAVGFYWNVDDGGMRCYVRKGAPGLNVYPAIFGSRSLWRQGERHILTLSWGERLAIFVDGKLLASVLYRGTLTTPLKDTRLCFSGTGFILGAVKVDDTPYEEGQPLAPAADAHTLLLDTFARHGAGRTRPERIAAGGYGRLEGVCVFSEATASPSGRELAFSTHKTPVPPKGVNLYYTVRELSNCVAEMWPLRSLGDEVFTSGEHFIYSVEKSMMSGAGGGYPWLQEHLVSGYVPAWRQPLFNGETDAAIATQGLSRWHNYYVEGMRWLMQHTGIDGLYLDGIGYDREIMKRIAKVMVRTDPNSRINFHGGNDYDYLDRRQSPANEYMEHFPYLSNLWFGELYDYNRAPDYWLVEISGLPFGLTSEMLNGENGGNAYRGMIYGMTGRWHPSVTAMWQFWDDFRIQDTEMVGYWEPHCPVRTNRPEVLATVYQRRGDARTRRRGDAETRRRGDTETRRRGDGGSGRRGDGGSGRVGEWGSGRRGDTETRRHGEGEARRRGDGRSRRRGDTATRRRGEGHIRHPFSPSPVHTFTPSPVHPFTETPLPKGQRGHRRKAQTLIALAHWPAQRHRPKAVVRLGAARPTIDGRLSPGEWDGAARLSGFTLFGQTGGPPEPTEAFVTSYGQSLSVGFRCTHAGPGIRANVSERDGPVWDDDALEVFIQPDPEQRRYVQIVGNSRGVFTDNQNQDTKWNGAWEYRASTGAGYWEGEMRLPLSSLGMKGLREGQAIGFNVCRDRQLPTRELSCWSPAAVIFHDTGIFGRVVFSSTKASTRQEAAPPGPKDVPVRLKVNWRALGLNPAKVRLVAPAIANFQPRAEFAPTDAIPVAPSRGWLLVATERGSEAAAP